MVPGVDRRLLLMHLVFQIAKRTKIVHRMDIAGDDIRQRTHVCTRDRVFRQERRLWLDLFEILNDGERLDEYLAVRRVSASGTRICGLTARYSGLAMPPAILDQMDRDRLVGDALEIERDAHAISGRRAEIRIELHGRKTAGSFHAVRSQSFCLRLRRQAPSDLAVSCASARSNASRSPGVRISVSRLAKSSACGASSSIDASSGGSQRKKRLALIVAIGRGVPAGGVFPGSQPPATPWSCACGYARQWPWPSSWCTGRA